MPDERTDAAPAPAALRTAAPPDDPAALRTRVAESVRSLRRRSGRSLAELAASAGIGKSTLHAIEAGDANPGIETLWSLAQALGVPFGALLEPPEPGVRVVRRDQGHRVDSERTTMRARLKTSTAHHGRVEVYGVELDVEHDQDASAHSPGTIEHSLVVAGRLRVGPLGAQVTLGPGDLASFPADVPHRYDALETGTEIVLLIEYR